jgi:hypothetical protein
MGWRREESVWIPVFGFTGCENFSEIIIGMLQKMVDANFTVKLGLDIWRES